MEKEEYEIKPEVNSREKCESCGVGQYFRKVKAEGGDWQAIIYDKCLPCKYNQMANYLNPLLKLVGKGFDPVDNWIPKV